MGILTDRIDMATIRERVPQSLRGPVSIASMGLGMFGITIGYILTLLGITLYFDLNGLGDAITTTESIVVTVIGLAALVVGYLGWRGFMYFAY